MSRRFVFIINPISGTGNKDWILQKIQAHAPTYNFPVHIFPAHRGGDYSDIKQFIAENGVTDVVIGGGDGTINGVLAALGTTNVSFGILPCGSGNGLALSAGLSKNLDLALQTVFTGQAVAVDAFTVNGHFACMLCGLGFDAQVAHDFANDPRRGLLTYLRKTVRHFFRAKTYAFDLQFGNSRLDLDAYFISIANSNQYGNNFTIAPMASLSDGLLDVVIAVRQSKLRLLLRTLSHVIGLNQLQESTEVNKRLGVVYFQTGDMVIQNHDQAPLHLDGDPAATAPQLNIKILKDHYRLIKP